MKSEQGRTDSAVPATTHAAHEGSDTRDRVARLLLELGSATAAELATGVKITPAAVRRHLDMLLADGLVEAADRAPHGPSSVRGPGRPAKVFSLTDAGRDAFEQAYDDLAADVLRFLMSNYGPSAVEKFARDRVAGLEPRYASAVAGVPAGGRLEALAAALSEDGYAASTRPAPGSATGEQICQHHCPVAHVAAEFPQLCEAETELLGRLLGTHVQRLATIAHGDGICTTHVPAPPSTWIDVTDLTAPSGRHAS